MKALLCKGLQVAQEGGSGERRQAQEAVVDSDPPDPVLCSDTSSLPGFSAAHLPEPFWLPADPTARSLIVTHVPLLPLPLSLDAGGEG